MTYWFRSRTAADKPFPDTASRRFGLRLAIRTILWMTALGAMAAFWAAFMFWPILIWVVAIAAAYLALGPHRCRRPEHGKNQPRLRCR
jgi:type VI protein secretion system component VasF